MIYDFIAEGLRRNVPEALAAHLNERIYVAEDLANEFNPYSAADTEAMARRLNDMCL